MAITSVGYDGTVSESDWAQMIPLVGNAEYGVMETTDWKVTVHTTLDRGVKVGVGTGWGMGVMDTSTTVVSLQGAAVSSGSRWDLVVARRDWSGTAQGGGETTFVLITGTPTKAIPNRNTDPGNIDDQPIALVQFTAGSNTATTIVDLRCYARNGGMAARDLLALDYLRHAGASITIGDTLWSRDLDLNGNPVWNAALVYGKIPLFDTGGAPAGMPAVPSGTTQFLMQAGSTVLKTDANGFGVISYPTPFPNGLVTITLANGDDTIFGDMSCGVAGANWGTSPANKAYTAFNLRGNLNGGRSDNFPNKTVRINWIAIGW
jgi:hypothetical protein